MNQKFVIHLAGKPASGKSTFAHLLGEKFPGLYRIFYDELKWQMSGYDRLTHRKLITQIEFGLFGVVLKFGVPIVFELFFESEAEYRRAQKMAVDAGYIWITIELEAPRDTLRIRFRERLADSKEGGQNMSIRDEESFMANLEHPFYAPDDRLIIDTAEKSIEENLTIVLDHMRERGIKHEATE